MLTEGGMRWQDAARQTAPARVRRKKRWAMGSIGQDELHFGAVLGSRGIEESADGLDGLAPLADDAGHIGLPETGLEDILALDRGVREENLVRMTGEPAEDEVEEFLHDRRVTQAALATAARAFFTILRTVSDICAPFLTQ